MLDLRQLENVDFGAPCKKTTKYIPQDARRLVAIPLLIHRAIGITKLFEQALLALFRLPLPGIFTTINITLG
jgi:hypothetical protein